MQDNYIGHFVIEFCLKEPNLERQNIARMTSAASAQGQIVYIVPIDQAFKKAQSVHIPVQSMLGVKKETVDVVDALACDIAGIVNEVQEAAA